MDENANERIVMTPKKKTARSTTLKMERKKISAGAIETGPTGGTSRKSSVHVAGGNNAGIVVNKEVDSHEDSLPPEISLEFRVFLRNALTQKYTQELRVISYWFKDDWQASRQPTTAQNFFKDLVCPHDFPRDYVGFIKKIMKLMQNEYPMISRIEIEMTEEAVMDCLPLRPRDLKPGSRHLHENDDASSTTSAEQLGQNDVLAVIEEAYPNSLTIDDIAIRFHSEKVVVRQLVLELVERKLIKPVGGSGSPGSVDTATGAFRRMHTQHEDNVTVVKQMPRGLGLPSGADKLLQPAIAIITSQYFEKKAVDAMMTNKRTFVRYATVGEANVYTLGDIGSQRVVSTKLPMTGRSREALIVTGGTTTRLLGTFQEIEQVFLVGVGGGVPHYTDFRRHVRLGDVVMSTPPSHAQKFIYQYCENVYADTKTGEVQYDTRSWCPPDEGLQEIAQTLATDVQWQDSNKHPWLKHYSAAVNSLRHDAKTEDLPEQERETMWLRPSAETDKLYMSVGNNDLIEVGHPVPRNGDRDPRMEGSPVLHAGPVAAGRKLVFDEQHRQEFSARSGILAFDNELDSVMESIYGNRKDCYMLIRGISDYKDGTRGAKDWQLYSSLMAAAVMKTVILAME